jgi:hypothetical protein
MQMQQFAINCRNNQAEVSNKAKVKRQKAKRKVNGIVSLMGGYI